MSKLLYHIEPGGVVTLTLNRPEVNNVYDDELVASLSDTLLAIEHDTRVRAVVLTGAGQRFCAGADLEWVQHLSESGEKDLEHDALLLARLMRTLNYLTRPTVARINGDAFGGGVGLIACCDIAVAVESARFALPESRLGLAPAVISPYVYRRIGEGHARRYFMSGEQFDATHARRIGLVQEVVTAAELDAVVDGITEQLLKGGPLAVEESKKLVFNAAGHDADEQLRLDQHTARVIAGLRTSPEGREGLQAFLEKRKPAWREQD